MDNWGKTKVGLMIVGILIATYFAYLAYPKIEVRMDYTDQNLNNFQNVEALIAKGDAGSSFTSGVCFSVKNTASILADTFPANNFNIDVKTEGATCTDCNVNTTPRVLKAQDVEPVCKKIKVTPNTEEFFIHITPNGDALGMSLKKKFTYTCSITEELDTRNKYNCGLTAIGKAD